MKAVSKLGHTKNTRFDEKRQSATAMTSQREHLTAVEPLPAIWARLSHMAAVLMAFGAVVGLLAPASIYGSETTALKDAATAQDLVGLVVVAPLLVVLGTTARRGSLRSWLCWLGLLSFTAYNFAIYAFSVHFGPLFLVWVAVLGLSVFALVGGLMALDATQLTTRFAKTAVRLPGWFMVMAAALFTLMWLGEVVPDLLADRPSSSAADWDVPSNPVHVLDLGIFLPAVLVSAVLLLHRKWFGYATSAGHLVFLTLTCLPAMATPFVANARGHAAGWSVLVPLGVIAIASLVMLWRLLRTPAPGRI